MANSGGQSIGCVKRHIFVLDMEEGPDHKANLVFVGLAITGHSLFDLKGGIFMKRAVVRSNGNQDSATDLAQDHSGFNIMGIERIFDGDFSGMVCLDKILYFQPNFVDPLVKRQAGRRADNTVLDHDPLILSKFDQTF